MNRFQSPSAVLRPVRPPPPALTAPSVSPAIRSVALIECPACRCSGTSQRFASVPALKEHLIQQHINVCPFCAACFVSTAQMHLHLNNRGLCPKPMNVAATNAKYECNICKANFLSQPREYYYHLIAQHQNKVNFNEKTGKNRKICKK